MYKEWQNYNKQFNMGLGFGYQTNGYKKGTLKTPRVP
jgi:hypothetical protein